MSENAQKITIITPENVYLELPLATLGNRIASFLVDSLILIALTVILVITIVILMALLSIGQIPFIIAALGMIAFFLLWNGYFIFFELKGGKTPGKMVNNYQVISEDGTALSASAIYIRNLMRELEIWMPLKLLFVLLVTTSQGHFGYVPFLWIFLCTLVPFFDKKRRRLGDLLAGTIVISTPKYQLEEDLTSKVEKLNQNQPFHFSPEMLDIYGKDELHALEQILRGKDNLQNKAEKERLVQLVVEKIIKKIGYKESLQRKDYVSFLQCFYQAQRAVLENRMIRGGSLKRKTKRWVKKLTGRK